ncbi:type II toxin-antitoxin system PemK/MazF family toxin [Oceanobacillus oncorhynchi]|uniref:type II toxin-antitoxin system PemK/MazF family toxin n=1 Tax=Oceanobacillus oncorhynchi TaxID=545501 RepID=UPI0034D39BE4
MFDLGDIFYIEVAYDDDPTQSKRRPAIVISEDGEDLRILITTTSKERNHPFHRHDYYKIPIHNWRKSGLTEPSWCRGKVLIEVSLSELQDVVSSEDFIGKLTEDDFNYIEEELIKLHDA